MTGPVIGSVSVSVTPDAEGFVNDLRARLLPQAGQVGDEFGRQMGEAIARRLAESIRAGLGSSDPGGQGRQQGQRFGDEFSRTMTTRIDAALRALPDATIGADITPASLKLDELKRKIAQTGEGFRLGTIDDKTARAQIDDLKKKLDELALKSPSIRVRVDAAAAAAQLAGLRAQEDAVNKSGATAFKPLLDGALLLGPALIPIAGALVTVGAGLVGLGAAGLLAFKGISNEMKTGTALGLAYKGQISGLKSELSVLEHTAASAVFPAFRAALKDVASEMPNLNFQFKGLAAQLGQIGGNLIRGIVSSLNTFFPLIRQGAQYVQSLAARFAEWAGGPGGAKFAQALGDAFTQTMPKIEALAVLATRLIAAFAPIGPVVVTVIGALTNVLNAIPLEVLSAAAVAFTTWRVAALGLSIVPGIITGVNAALRAMGITAAISGAAVEGILGPLALVAGAIGAAIFLFRGHKQAVIDDSAAISNYSQLLQESSGAINANVRAGVAKQAADSGLLDVARKLGVGTGLVTSAITGQSGATQELRSKLEAVAGSVKTVTVASGHATSQWKEYTATGQQATTAQIKTASSAKDLLTQINYLVGGFQTAAERNADYRRELGLTNAAANTNARALGSTVDSYLAASDAAAKQAAQLKATTLQMQIQNDAAGLLNQALNSLAGQNLSVAQAQTALSSSILSGTATLRQNGNTVALNTEKGIANRQALEGMASALRTKATADAAAGVSTDKVTRTYNTNRASLLNQIAATFGARSAIYSYVASITRIPPVKATRLDIDNRASAKIATVRNEIAHIPSLKGITVTLNNVGNVQAQIAQLTQTRALFIDAQVRTAPGQPAIGGHLATNAAGGGIPEGWSTVGEQGWEAVYKSGNSVHVYSHPTSKTILPQGPAVPTFAAGTGPAPHAASPNVGVRVFIGDKELTDLVSVIVDDHTNQLVDTIGYGRNR